ncbi:MAG TPA: YHS domain-containing protein [Chloroflexota bacterium]|nr:YHS domain-containing protein [Chloroflexota bacterium]
MGVDGQLVGAPTRVVDPVCGMELSPSQAMRTVDHGGRTYSFCSEQCAEKFQADPDRYASPEQAMEGLSSPEGVAPFLEAEPTTAKRPVPSVTTGVPPNARIVYVELPIEKLDCATCAQRVQQALEALPGVKRAAVNPETRRATVVYDRQQTDLTRMAEAVRQVGYEIGSTLERIGIVGMT